MGSLRPQRSDRRPIIGYGGGGYLRGQQGADLPGRKPDLQSIKGKIDFHAAVSQVLDGFHKAGDQDVPADDHLA